MNLSTRRMNVSNTKTGCPSEHEEQVRLVHWFKKQYPNVGIFAIPNGGHRNKVTAYKMKMEGQSKGVPDLFIPEWKLFIEMKRQKGGRLSPEQKEWLNYLESVGYETQVCNGFEQARDYITGRYAPV